MTVTGTAPSRSGLLHLRGTWQAVAADGSAEAGFVVLDLDRVVSNGAPFGRGIFPVTQDGVDAALRAGMITLADGRTCVLALGQGRLPGSSLVGEWLSLGVGDSPTVTVWRQRDVERLALMAPVVAEPVRQAQSSSPTARPATIATRGIPDADRYQEFRQAAQGLGEGVATWCGQLIAEAEQGRDARALQQRRQAILKQAQQDRLALLEHAHKDGSRREHWLDQERTLAADAAGFAVLADRWVQRQQ